MLKLSGCYTALVTPFRGGGVDYGSLRRLIRFQLRSGVTGLVPCGSTGEAATLTEAEYLEVIRVTISEARGRACVLPGVASNSTARAVETARKAAALKPDGLLALVPYYNKPTQAGMAAHFSAIASAVELPVVLYNIPGRTGVNMLPVTMLGLAARHKNIVGVKEASGSLDQVSEIVNRAPKTFAVMSGDDSLTLPMMAVGAKGVISVVSNVRPVETVHLCARFAAGDAAGAARLHHRLFPLVKALFAETNPIPVKYAVSALGYGRPEPRLPLLPLSAPLRAPLRGLLGRGAA
jgi:4-hydroxy-tetrahydrodipicolinate synthase